MPKQRYRSNVNGLEIFAENDLCGGTLCPDYSQGTGGPDPAPVPGEEVSPPLPAGHTYWRINISALQSGEYGGIGEIEMRATAGGADQAEGGTATASNRFNSAYDESKVFDGSPTTGWLTDGSALPYWIQYQFATPVSVAELAIMSASLFNSHSGDPKDFTLAWSDDGAAFTTVLTVVGSTAWPDGPAFRTFAV